MKNNEFENIDNEIKVKGNLSEESSDTIYKNRFRFKKNSIQIKKNSLLKTKIKNSNLEGTIINDPRLSNLVQFNNKDDNTSCIENNIITKDIQNEELEKYSMKKNSKNKKPTVVFTKLTTIQKKKYIKNTDENITNEIKNDKKKEKNVLIKNKHSNELNTSLNDKSSYTNIKSPLDNISNFNKSKTNNQKVHKKNEIHKNFLRNKHNLVNNNINQIDNQNNSIEIINYNTTTDKTDESPLSLLKKHGKLIKYINEIHMSNSEEIINLRNEFSTIKSDLNKIMNIISIGQKAVSSLK
ncbi:conserved Plasmodium protein, unknown function [Plasmodium berghei]|uniref:Uncharacterized protein n=2 Tax=Plasmodium berghei TaxID=5821 RepID=A0A509AJF6_PLABA|nr:conserved Plasmodium protein, unknown function [Plasmodium berghei ANKA]CXI39946.1 conserved Plasmodium protein, unknown function [Plasmodium berghei]SCM21761.1 conserved Plasmodium protein, unknown function [Plasmodium berghei]SCN25013.1 conserved Plasmodium protein, unknown function [Plasmodium berghei]SCO60065.1 conserved Plasmodium protein, unknown function [Plasmodium berghei]SCO61544.1 conserved Plasmodium protein, unknown function [Plasmodium berghei]|eukprot:XP_034421399.1 conserved Plasmodium protein, unknown function [Plasmodium berghei ANKA]